MRRQRIGRSIGPGGGATLFSSVIVSALLVGSGTAPAYRFFSDGEGRRVVGAQNAAHWSAQVWEPGETLVWEIGPDPDWEVFFDTPEGVLPFADQAQAVWSDIPTADISWIVDGVGDAVDDHDDSARDGRNTLFIDSDGPLFDIGGYASIWFKFGNGRSEIVECDIALGPQYADVSDRPAWEDPDFFKKLRQDDSISILVHEFGHCLGLGHSGRFSRTWTLPFAHAPSSDDPAMAYGYRLDEDGRRFDHRHEPRDRLTADDVTGASLLRPVRGSRHATGGISGTFRVAEEPAGHVLVWALPLDGDPMRDRVAAFSDQDGAFLIEGLPPGDYVLAVQPIWALSANRDLVENNAPNDIGDRVFLRPVRVVAGETTESAGLRIGKGRTPREPPPRAFSPGPDQGPPNAIVGEWAAVCRGMQIQAQRPRPAHGPLWFERSVPRIRGDRWFGTTLTIEMRRASGNLAFDWLGPYRHWYWDRETEELAFYPSLEEGVFDPACGIAVLDVDFIDWRIEAAGSVVRHSLEIAWPETAEVRLQFRSDAGACDGEPEVVCNLRGCGILQ